jgi:glutamine amidotransferase
MCELFGMSGRYPATVSMSLGEFSRHGGETGPHGDGWGIAFYEGADARVIREPVSAADSRCAGLIGELDLVSSLVISHIRKATVGDINLANTQPFSRELGGHRHVFAHNGDLEGIEDVRELSLGRFRPIGDTDSERAWCALLAHLEPLWIDGQAPPIASRLAVVQRFADVIRPLGPANFLYSDGDALFVHGDRRTQGGPGGPKIPPGLHTLCRTCQAGSASDPAQALQTRGLTVSAGSNEQRVVLVASVPLTDEDWQPSPAGEVMVFRQGERVRASLAA